MAATALRAVAMDGLEGDALACQGMRVSVELDPEEAALVRCLMRERGHLVAELTVHDLIALGARALSGEA